MKTRTYAKLIINRSRANSSKPASSSVTALFRLTYYCWCARVQSFVTGTFACVSRGRGVRVELDIADLLRLLCFVCMCWEYYLPTVSEPSVFCYKRAPCAPLFFWGSRWPWRLFWVQWGFAWRRVGFPKTTVVSWRLITRVNEWRNLRVSRLALPELNHVRRRARSARCAESTARGVSPIRRTPLRCPSCKAPPDNILG